MPGPSGPIDGWMDDDIGAVATQLFGGGPNSLLVIDGRDLISSTARVVGSQMGELHFKMMMALITLHVSAGMPEDGKCSSTIGEMGRLIWGADRAQGGKNTRVLLRTLLDLREARFTVPGYDAVNGKIAQGISDMSLMIGVYVDETIMRSFEAGAQKQIDRGELGREFGSKRAGTVAWQLHPEYVKRLAGSDLRRFDWAKAQQLRGVALALWMVFTSPRVPYRQVLEDPELEMVEVPLTPESCAALGVFNQQEAGRRRTLNHAGDGVKRADRSFVAFEAHTTRNRQSFLRVVRKRPSFSPLEPAHVARSEQLSLTA